MTIECLKDCNPRDGHVADCPRTIAAQKADEDAARAAQEAQTARQSKPPKPTKEQQPHIRESSYAAPPPASPVEPVQVIARPVQIESVVHPPLPTQGGSAVQTVKTTAKAVQSGAPVQARARALTPEQQKAEWDAAQKKEDEARDDEPTKGEG